MKKAPIALLFALAALAILAYPSTTTAITLTHHFVVPHGVTGHGEQHRVAVTTVAPTDSDLDGVADSADKCPQTAGESAYDGCEPPAPDPVATTPPASYAPSSAPTTTTVSTTSALPSCTWAPESGGSYTAVNPSSGAGGKYQFLPSTWQSLGYSGAPQDAPPAEQEAAAQQLYAEAGTSPWVNC